MKIKITAGLVIITVILSVLCLSTYMMSDRIAPEITVPSADITYEEGTDKAKLLEGVEAIDDIDGDISEQVRIYDISVVENGERAMITYAVYDDSYNLAKAYKVVDYVPAYVPPVEEETEDVEETESETTEEAKKEEAKAETTEEAKKEEAKAETTEEAKKEETKAETTEEAKKEEAKTETTEGSKKDDETTEAVAPDEDDYPALVVGEKPVMRLRTNVIRVTERGSFDPLDYVDTAIDDEDTVEYLFSAMQLEGDYDTTKPGEYQLTYYCMDSDGHKSNMCEFTLIVTERK
ncbi:MAG: bacterial Ig-like domain-containing protein [Lachnospiraceae bacterium]|nr:bacterial Ig-like domain-containing protein [Lachnospiraceae bacterium]